MDNVAVESLHGFQLKHSNVTTTQLVKKTESYIVC